MTPKSRLEGILMTDVVTDPTAATSHYTPEGYAAHLNSLLNHPWPEGATPRETEHELMRVLIEVADAYIAGEALTAARLVAQKLPGLPVELSPMRYFRTAAEQMAVPVWGEYTAEQRQRGYQYAARYVRTRLTEWLRPPHRHSPAAEPEEPFNLRDLPYPARRAHMDLFHRMTWYRRTLTMMQAYLATHPGGEVQPAQLRAITERWTDFRSEQGFF
jgi:hypothetical protein